MKDVLIHHRGLDSVLDPSKPREGTGEEQSGAPVDLILQVVRGRGRKEEKIFLVLEDRQAVIRPA